MDGARVTEETPLKGLLGRSDEAGDAMLDSVIKDIFVSCDVANEGMVETSKLIEFIAPFLQADATAAAELKKSLDPGDSNPMIDIETFHAYMKQWTLKISGVEAEDFHNVTPRDFQRLDEGDVSFVQSTPRSSFGHHLLKGYVESGIMNVSSCSTYSLNDFTTAKGPDRTMLEEHIQELEHQKKRMAEELSRMRAELASSLEANDSLQGELEKTLKRLSNEQKLNEQLQSEKKREDENEAELLNAKKQVAKLEKLASAMEKQVAELNGELEEMRIENQRLEEKKAKIAKKTEEAFQEVISLRTEVEVWKQNVGEAREVNAVLREENRHLQDVIEQCSCEIDKLKFEKATMEKFLKATARKDSSSSSFPRLTRSNSLGEYSPMIKRLLTKHVYNTPNTRSKLDNPVSPLADSPFFTPKGESTPEEVVKVSESLSPPTMYIIDRTDEQEDEEAGSKESDSGDDLPVKLHFMAAASDTNESLQEEMSKVASEDCSSSSERQCRHKLKYLESEKRILTVQSELMDHIQKQARELEDSTKLLKDYELKISQLANEVLDLKTQLSLSCDKEAMLLERNRSLEETLGSNKLHITEIGAKLAERADLEAKCKDLEVKIERLENENSVKYVKIVDLTIEVDRLKSGSSMKIDESASEETLSELRRQKEEIQAQLMGLKSIEDERVGLKIEKETLLAKIMNLEESNKDLELELGALKKERDEALSAKSSNSTLEKEQRDLIELSFKLKLENLEREKGVIYEDRQRLSDEIVFVNQERDNLLHEIKRLRKQLRYKEEELHGYENLKKEMDEKNEEILTLKSEKNALNSQLKELKTQLGEYQAKLEEYKNNNSGLLQKNEEIAFNLEKARSESTMFKNDKNTLEKEHEVLKEKISELTRTLEKNKKDYDILRVTHEICEQNRKELNQKSLKDLETYRGELSRIERENEALRSENFHLKSNVNTLDGELFQLKEKISFYHAEKHDSDEIKYNLIREKRDLSLKLEKKEVNLKKTIEESQTTISSYSNLNEQLKETNEELNGLLLKKDELISQLKETNEALRLEVEELAETSKELEETKINLKRKEAIASEVETLKETKQSLNEEIFLYKETCESYKHKVEDLENLIEKKDALLEDRELKISELQKEIDRKLKEIKACTEEFEATKKRFEEERRISQMQMENNNRLVIELDESRNENVESLRIIKILEDDVKNLKEGASRLKDQIDALTFENKTLKDLLDYPENLLERLKELSEENEMLREECKKFCIEDKVKMIEETNKSFSDALQKMYTAEKKLSETEEDFSEYCKREIEKYKIENAKFKSEIASLREEKRTIVELETGRESPMNSNKICERCRSDSKIPSKKTNFDKLNIRREKLERKVQDLEDQLFREKKSLAEAASQREAIERELETLKAAHLKLRSQLEETEKKEEVRLEELHQLKESLSQKRFRLERYTLSVATSYRIPESFLRKMLVTDAATPRIPDDLLYMEKEICRTREQMDITVNVLDYVATRKAKMAFNAVGCQTEDSSVFEQRRPPLVRSPTFTLRPATLDLRFASSGDAGRSRDLGVLFPRQEDGEEEKEDDGDEKGELEDQDASPTLNEDTLEDLGLLQGDSSELATFPDQELEEKFGSVSEALMTDSASMTTRFANQAALLTARERCLAAELASCRGLLEEFLRGDQLNAALTRLESLLSVCDQLCASAALLGSLKHERRMTSCVRLMIRYAAHLKRRLEDVEDRLGSIGHQVKGSSHHQQQLQLTDFERVVPQLDARSASAQNVSLPLETRLSPRPSSRTKQIVTRCLCVWMIFVTVCCLFLLSALNWDGDSVHLTLPWSWKSFDDPWAPFIKKRYLNGPPPT